MTKATQLNSCVSRCILQSCESTIEQGKYRYILCARVCREEATREIILHSRNALSVQRFEVHSARIRVHLSVHPGTPGDASCTYAIVHSVHTTASAVRLGHRTSHAPDVSVPSLTRASRKTPKIIREYLQRFWRISRRDNRMAAIIWWSRSSGCCRDGRPRSSYPPSAPSATSSGAGCCKFARVTDESSRNFRPWSLAVYQSVKSTAIYFYLLPRNLEPRGTGCRVRLTRICMVSTRSSGPCRSRYPPAESQATLGSRFPATPKSGTRPRTTRGQELSAANRDAHRPGRNYIVGIIDHLLGKYYETVQKRFPIEICPVFPTKYNRNVGNRVVKVSLEFFPI